MSTSHNGLRIAIVGGRERNELPIGRAAKELGMELTFHDGKVAGTGSATLQRMAQSSDAIVILTDVNSHRGVLTAKEAARQHSTPFLLLRRLSVSRLEELKTSVIRSLQQKSPQKAA